MSDLKIQLSRKQYQTIFKVADYVRRYKWKHECFNKHKKYKYLRPMFPVCQSDEMLKQEMGLISIDDDTVSFAAVLAWFNSKRGHASDQSELTAALTNDKEEIKFGEIPNDADDDVDAF